MSYYDLNAILTDSQKLPCTFNLTVPTLGYLSGNPGSALKESTKLELPLWLAEMLVMSSSSDPPITMDMPAPLQKRVINALKAEPRVVDLRAQAPHFYALGARMLELFEDEEVGEVLLETFRRRAVEIADQAGKTRGGSGAGVGEGGEFVRGLEEEERKVFAAASEGGGAVAKWFQGLARG